MRRFPEGRDPTGAWIVTEVRCGEELFRLPNTADGVFVFDGERFSGSAGCNRITGELTLAAGGGAVAGAMASTRMACSDEAVMQFEAALGQALELVDAWGSEGDLLVFTGPETEVVLRPRE